MTQKRPTASSSIAAPWLTAAESSAQEAHLEILRGKLQTQLEEIVESYEGVAGVHVLDLTTGDRFSVNDEFLFPQASAIKIPILLELFRRSETDVGMLSTRVEMNEEIRTGGSGVLRHLTNGGSVLSLEDYAVYMIVYSDNTPTNVMIDELGMDAINALSESLGAPNTKLQRKMDPTRGVRSWEREPLDAEGRGPHHGADCQLRLADERELLRPGP